MVMNKAKLLGSAVLIGVVGTQTFAQEAVGDAVETVVVTGTRAQNASIIESKRETVRIEDTLGGDDIGQMPELNISESLGQIPGVATIFDEDRGRFVTVRGLKADLNYTTIDGIGIATTDDFGGTGRRVNLEVIPSKAVSKLVVRKTFTPDVDGGAIGGYVNLRTRSAYDTHKTYFVVSGGLNHFTESRVPAGNSYAGDPYSPVGGQVDVGYADTFGANDQFGVVIGASWQLTSRDQSKDIQAGENYFDSDGSSVSPLLDDGSINPEWNGYVAPNEVRSYDYTNQIEDYGANIKLEYQPGDSFYVSLLSFYYHEGQQETRNTFQLQSLSTITNQTATSGTLVIPSKGARIGWSRNNLDRNNWGFVLSSHYKISEEDTISLVSGWTYNDFDDFQPTIDYRGQPSTRTVSYEQVASNPIRYKFTVTDTDGITNPANYKLYAFYDYLRFSKENVFDTKIDYAHNVGSAVAGFGFQVGGEFRRIDRVRDNGRVMYTADSSVLTPYAMQTNYQPRQFNFPLLWIDANKFLKEKVSTLSVNESSSASYNAQDDFTYLEDTISAYGMISYAGERWKFLGGLRYEHIANTSTMPGEDLTAAFVTSSGGYGSFLPSATISYDVTDDLRLKFGASRSVGRPDPGDVATRERRNDTSLTITRGNPDLKPRESTNVDAGLEYYMPNNTGLFSAAVFYKNIRNEIYTYSSTEEIDGDTYTVTQPRNAAGATVKGLELAFIKNSFDFLPAPFDGFGFSSNLTWVDGGMSYMGSDFDAALGNYRKSDQLVEQPDWVINTQLFYNWKNKAEIRLSYNYTGRYYDSISSDGYTSVGWAPRHNLDMTANYNLTGNLRLIFKARNMLNYSRVRTRGMDLSSLNEDVMYGKSYYLSLQYKY